MNILIKRREERNSKEIGVLSCDPFLPAASGFWLALLQVEAGKGLEMRKLVLSGFLASEEIYINQLEALLLVSMGLGGGGVPVSQCPALKLLLELEKTIEDRHQHSSVHSQASGELNQPLLRLQDPPVTGGEKTHRCGRTSTLILSSAAMTVMWYWELIQCYIPGGTLLPQHCSG